MSIATEVRHLDNARNWITFDGKALTDFKVYCSGDKTFSAPQRNVDSITIPGRNGTLERDKGTFANITVEYSCWIPSNFRQNIEGLRNYMLSKAGFKRLEDTYDPDTYRLASFHGPLDVSAYYQSTFGSFTLQFIARPERFLKSGETAIALTAGSNTITNPTLFNAKPLIEVNGNEDANISVGDKVITLTDDVSQMFIDVENLNAYGPTGTNMNDKIEVSDKSRWFELEPGINTVYVNGFTYVNLTPRWWIL